jgi:hypothetical protein
MLFSVGKGEGCISFIDIDIKHEIHIVHVNVRVFTAFIVQIVVLWLTTPCTLL